MKKLIAALTVICMVSSLAACGSSGSSGSTTNGDGSAPSQKVSVTETTSDTGEKVSITVFSEWVGSHPFAPYFAARLASFREAHPEIEVNVEEIAGSSTANMDAKLKVLVSSGELPDVFYTNDKSIIDLAKKSNLLYDMKAKLDADTELNSELDMADIAAWNEGTDHVYGICSHKDFFGFFYNTEMLKQAGFETFPTSWDDYYALGDKLKENGKALISLETKTAWYPSLALLGLLASQNETGRNMANTVGVTDYNTPEFIEAATQLQKMFADYSTTDAPGSDVSISLNNFTSGNTAMVLDGAWRITELTGSAIGANVDVALLPGNGAVSYPGYAWFSGSQDEQKAAASYEFIKWVNNKEDQTVKLEMLGLIPASSNIDFSTMELPDLMIKLLNLRAQTDYTVLSCWRVYPAAVVAIIPQELAALATGQNTPQQFAENLTKASE